MPEVMENPVMENPLLQLVQDGPLVIRSRMPADEFDRFVLQNSDLRIERDKFGTITIHPPMTYNSAKNESRAFFFLQMWGHFNPQLGDILSPSASFNLPDGSQCKADGAFVPVLKAALLSSDELDGIPHLVPDFVMEMRSKTDRLSTLKKKMEEVWMANGVRLAWLLDPQNQKAWVYRSDGSVEEIPDFDQKLSGEDVLPGFELDLQNLKLT